ncbi:uncharacterized protein LOC135152837 [Daucus carota subsp. sativus]|uniref:uncharacterized protein LOC135152837 n=1 Tax=Daucus carota subsp. sativus TaxID=79200 RepID=UPI0030836FD4
MDLPPVQQHQPQQQPQPSRPLTPSRSSASKSTRATKSDAAPSTVKTRTSVATQVLKTKSDVPTNSTVPPASPQSRKVRFKARANKPKKAKIPITEITDFTLEEEQAPSTTLPDSSQALMVHPLQAVPLSTATASSTSSEVDEEILCKEPVTTEAGTTLSVPHTPISDHGPSTPLKMPQSPLKFPKGAIIHDTAPENYKSDASLAKAGEEPSKSKSADQENVVPDPVKDDVDHASDDDEDDENDDDENEDETSKSVDGLRTEVANFKETQNMDEKRHLLPLKEDMKKLMKQS